MILGGSTAERKEEVEGKGRGERGGDGINMHKQWGFVVHKVKSHSARLPCLMVEDPGNKAKLVSYRLYIYIYAMKFSQGYKSSHMTTNFHDLQYIVYSTVCMPHTSGCSTYNFCNF